MPGNGRIIAPNQEGLTGVSIFCTHHLPVWIRPGSLRQFVLAVILPHYIHHFGKTVLINPGLIGTEKRHGNRTRSVQFMNQILLHLISLKSLLVVQIITNFVTYTDDEYGGMIAVTQSHRPGVCLPPLIKIKLIAVIGIVLPGPPGIKSLVHNKEAHAVAQVQKLRSKGIVRSSNGIDAQLAQALQTLFPNTQWHGGAYGASVVVQTNPFQTDVLLIQKEALSGIKIKRTNSKRCFLQIKLFSINPLLSHIGVKQWRIERP